MNTLYELNVMPEYPGQLSKPYSAVDDKHRVCIPSDLRSVIAGRNASYVAHLRGEHSPFKYNGGNIYLDGERIGMVDAAEENGDKQKDLVRILGEPEQIVNLHKINSGIHVITETLENKVFLVGYSFFDWKLYLNDIRVKGKEQEYGMLFKREYSMLEIDAQGRILIASFECILGIRPRDTLGFKGFRDSIVIGKPEDLTFERFKPQRERGLSGMLRSIFKR